MTLAGEMPVTLPAKQGEPQPSTLRNPKVLQPSPANQARTVLKVVRVPLTRCPGCDSVDVECYRSSTTRDERRRVVSAMRYCQCVRCAHRFKVIAE